MKKPPPATVQSVVKKQNPFLHANESVPSGTPAAADSGNADGSGSAAAGSATSATAESAHNMLVAIAITSAFVAVMVTIGGTGRNAGRLSALLMFALVVNQGLRHVSPFVEWVNAHPLTPQGNEGS